MPEADRKPLTFDFASLSPLPAPGEFTRAAAELGIEFEDGDLDRLGRYLAMLLKANEAMNLTAVTDAAEAWTRHILDSLTLMAPLAELPEGGKVIDVGSGGGLPGLPLAIVMPHLSFTLLEATGKKVEFLKAVIKALALKNATVLQGRARNRRPGPRRANRPRPHRRPPRNLRRRHRPRPSAASPSSPNSPGPPSPGPRAAWSSSSRAKKPTKNSPKPARP